MPKTEIYEPRPFRPVVWLVCTLLLCAHFCLIYVFQSAQFLNLRAYAAGQAPLPYQGRVLMAYVLHLTAGNPIVGGAISHLAAHFPPDYRDPFLLVIFIVNFVTLFISVLACRAVLLRLIPNRAYATWASLLVIHMTYFTVFVYKGPNYTVPYDLPSLAFFSIYVWLLFSKRYWLMLPIFALATLNRETSCFLILFMLLYGWFSASGPQFQDAGFRRMLPHILLQSVLWLGIRLFVHHLFRFNPHPDTEGGLFQLHLLRNLESIAKPQQWPVLFSTCGFLLPLLFASYRWIGNEALAKSTVIIVVLWIFGMLIVGNIVEIRIFNELTVFVAPAIALIIWNRWGPPSWSARLQQDRMAVYS